MSKLLMEAIHRSVTGPIMAEEAFETELLPDVLADLQSKHRIEWDPDEPVMIDPSLADAIFQAGKELLLEVGLYCKNTKRIVKFSEEEIAEALCSARHQITLGCDRQAIALEPRAPGDARYPFTFPPAGAFTTNVETYKYHARSVMLEPTCDGVIPVPLYAIDNMKNIADTPAQTLVCLTEARVINEAAAWAGKPGLWFGIPMSATTPLALISAFSSGLYHKNNCTLPVQILQDMRVDYDRLNLAFFAQQQGLEPWMSSCPALYAYLTGPEQAAIEIIAHTLAMLAYSGGTLTQAMSVTVHGSYLGNDITWCNSAAALAAERNLKLPWVCAGHGNGFEALDDGSWYGVAIACINGCISGVEGLWNAGGFTGLQARWAGEIARAATRLAPREGRDIIKRIYKKIDPAEGSSSPDVPFDELYDMKTLRPQQALVDQYRKFTRIFRELGLDYPTWRK
ncbi:MAG: monomethylamine:corrinoid methyltransferase [Candidatus Binatia bacterium]